MPRKHLYLWNDYRAKGVRWLVKKLWIVRDLTHGIIIISFYFLVVVVAIVVPLQENWAIAAG